MVMITMTAVLININNIDKKAIDNLMTVFCSAVRYGFKRILEGMEIGQIEKEIAFRYGLNIRQSKDAVENARQTLVSQKELVKINYENYMKKVNAIENILNDKNKKLTDKKRNALKKKLEKRQRKLQYYKNFIETNTISPVTFGTKEMFIKRCKGLITKKQWQECRANRIYSRGDKTKKGNPNLRVIYEKGRTFIEISTLDKTETNRAIKIKVEVYLPQKLSTTTGKVNGINYKQIFLDYLKTGEAYQVELIKRNGKYYCHITFEENKVRQQEVLYKGHKGMIGIDTNPDGFALTMIDRQGNYKWHTYLKCGELTYARSDRRQNLCGELVRQVIKIAKINGYGIAIEDLKFADDRDVNRKFARIKHQFIYRQLLIMLERACIREGIELSKEKPQFTSKIGLYKYCHQFGMDVHNGAGMVIARRSYGFKEKVTKILKKVFIDDNEQFNRLNEWKKWTTINKLINEKGVNNTVKWLSYRKAILGIG